MNTRRFLGLRRWLATVGILSVLSSLVVVAPIASAYAGTDATAAGFSWAASAVDEACDKGLIDCDLADPAFGQTVTRAVAYQMLTSGFGVLADTAQSPFTDVEGQWYAAAANTAFTLGWTSGVGDNKFGGAQTMTRAQLATAAAKALGLSDCDATVLDAVTDANLIPSYAVGPMACMLENKLMVGSNNKLDPMGGANKAQVIVVMNAQVNYAAENEIDVLEVAATQLGVDADTVQQALDEGMNIVDGELVSVAGTPETPVNPEGPVPPVGGSVVAAVSNTPAGSTLPLGAKSVQLLQFSLSAAADTAVDSVKFSRSGPGVVADFANVYIYEGANRLKSGKTISSDTNMVEFTGLNMVVRAGTPRVLTLRGDVAASGTATASDQHMFSVVAVASNGTVTGLPVSGSTFTIGAVSVGTVTMAPVSTISSPTLGQSNAECGNFRVSAGANDIEIREVTLTNGGTLSRSSMANFNLVQPGYSAEGVVNGVVATTAAINDKDRVVFALATPFMISKNQNRNFEVRCDILGGKTTDTVKLYLDETSDALVIDKQYNFGSNVTNSMGSSAVTAVTLQGGKLTFADNGPLATNLSKNSTNKEFFNFSVTADRSLTVRDFFLMMEQTAWASPALQAGTGSSSGVSAGGGTISTAGAVSFTTEAHDANIAVNDVLRVEDVSGSNYYVKVTAVAASTMLGAGVTGTVIYPDTTPSAAVVLVDADDYDEVFDATSITLLKNLKLVDTDTHGTIASVTNSNYAMAFSDDFDISAGQTRHFSLQADLDTSFVAGNAFRGGFDFTQTDFIRDNEANQSLVSADIVGGNLFGKPMTVVASSLTLSLASTPVSETHVKGEQAVNLAGFSVQGGDGGSIKVTRVNVRLMADVTALGATFDNAGYGDTAANTLVTTVGLYSVVGNTYTRIGTGDVGLTLVGTIGASGGYYRAQFNNLTQTIAKSETQKWVVRVNLANTIGSTSYLAAVIDADTDLTVQDADGNSVTASGSDLNLLAAPTVTKTIETSGSLAVTELSSPNAAILVAGTSDNVVAREQFSATNESFKVTKLNIQLPESSVSGDPFTDTAATTASRSITSVKLRYTNSVGATEVKSGTMSSGVVNFTGLDILVGKNATANVEILVDLNTIAAGAATGDVVRLGISTVAGYTYEAVGQGSGTTDTDITPTNQANINSMVVRKAAPIVAKATTGLPSSLTNGTVKVYGVNVTANGGTVSLKRLAFTLNASVDTADTMSQFKLYQGGSAIESSRYTIYTKYGTDAEGVTDITGSTNGALSEVLTVTFDDTSTREETIAAGATQSYYLEATVGGASTGNNLSINIADDTVQMAATGGVDEFEGTSSQQGNSVVWRFDAGALAATADDQVYIDVNGDGDYSMTYDYAVASGTVVDLTSTLADNIYLAGALRLDGDQDSSTDADTFYFDLDGGADYDAATEPAFASTADGILADGAITYPVCFTATTTIYFDVDGTCAAYAGDAIGTDFKLTVVAGPAGTANTELRTSNMNFVWSDNGEANGTVHTTSTSAWTNGLNVDNLSTQSLSLSF